MTNIQKWKENGRKKLAEIVLFVLSIPSLKKKKSNVYYVLETTLDAGVTAMNKNLCPHEVYVLAEKEDQETKQIKYVLW